MTESHYLVVGAGAAGSVLASRLSEDPRNSVVLVEAGDDVVPGREPADIRCVYPLSAFNRAYLWPDTLVHWDDADHGAPVPLPQGRIVGGSSAVMGMWALRGRPDDYDGWRDAGADGWSWADVLPYFRKLERDVDFAGPLHGADGPIPICREPSASWPPFASAVARAAVQGGLPQVDDMNADFGDGHCSLPISRHAETRAAAGICYLDAAVRTRPNLRVLARLEARSLRIEAGRVTGLQARARDGSLHELRAHETLIAAGALRSPALLQRSGIGDGDELRAAGIPVLLHRRGVGRNLQNHPVLYLTSILRSCGRQPRGWRPAGSTYVRFSSGLHGAPIGDLALYVRSGLSWNALGRRMASIAPLVTRPFARGSVRLEPTRPDGPPRIEFRFGSEPRDLARLVQGLQFAVALYESGPVRKVSGEAWLLADAGRAARFNQRSTLSALRAAIVAGLLDLAPASERRLLERSQHFRAIHRLADAPDALLELVRTHVTGTGHVCGTCRIGRVDDADAVVDAVGRVHGIGGLRVVDASVMPTVPSGNTHIPTVMVAEKLADALRAERH